MGSQVRTHKAPFLRVGICPGRSATRALSSTRRGAHISIGRRSVRIARHGQYSAHTASSTRGTPHDVAAARCAPTMPFLRAWESVPLKQFRSTVRFGAKSSHEGNLVTRLARGGAWLALGSGGEQLFRLARNMILARLLAPEAFGTMAIVLAVSNLLESLTQIGVREAIVQNPDATDDTYLNGAWFVSVGRSILLCVGGVVLAPYIATFYHDSDLSLMIRVAFLSLVFRSAISVRAYVSVKQLNFAAWIKIEQLGGMIGVTAAILLSVVIRNVWSLVIGYIVEAAAALVLSFVFCPHLPRFRFNTAHMRSLLRFAGGMFGIPALTFVFLRGDVFVIGKVLTAAELGLYSMAASLADAPSLAMQKFVSPLLMPAFSEIQNEDNKITQGVLNVTSALATLLIPLGLFVATYGSAILRVAFTPQYSQVAVPFALLFTASTLRNLIVPTAAVYLAKGRPKVLRLLTGLRAGILFVLIFPLVRSLGLVGAAVAVLSAMLISAAAQIIQFGRLTGLSLRRYVLTLAVPLLSSVPLIVLIPIRASHSYSSSLHPAVDLVIGATCMVLAIATSLLIAVKSKQEWTGMLFSVVRRLRPGRGQ